MKKFKFIILISVLISCQDDDLDYAPPLGLDVGKLEQNIHDSFQDKVVGYGWGAYRDGELISSGGNGWARAPENDTDSISYKKTTIGTIFSTTKTITAASFIDNMSEWGIGLDDQIIDYLPSSWRVHQSIKDSDITFKKLLKHTSGFLGTVDQYTKMRDTISLIGVSGTVDNRVYSNMNYTLFRVLIPHIFNNDNFILNEKGGDQAIIDYCADVYENFIRIKMDKAGVEGFQYTNTYYLEAQPYTLYYDFDAYKAEPSTTKGQLMDDCHDISGAGGWFMMPFQYAAFIDGLFNGKIVSESNLQIMKNEELGMYKSAGEYGTYYTHNGGGGWTVGPEFIKGRGGQCIWMHFPVANLSLFIAWNSLSDELEVNGARTKLIKEIFEKAYNE